MKLQIGFGLLIIVCWPLGWAFLWPTWWLGCVLGDVAHCPPISRAIRPACAEGSGKGLHLPTSTLWQMDSLICLCLCLSVSLSNYLGVETLILFSRSPVLVIQCASASSSVGWAGRKEWISEVSYFVCPKLWSGTPALDHLSHSALYCHHVFRAISGKSGGPGHEIPVQSTVS